jgi:hypothetical protein
MSFLSANFWKKTPAEEFLISPYSSLDSHKDSKGHGVYYTFLASLPPLPTHFQVERLPISREQINERMTMLPPEDRESIQLFWDILHELQYGSSVSDEMLLDQLERDWKAIPNPVGRQILGDQLTQTYLLTAIQRKQENREPPLGPHPLEKHVHMYWSQAGFGLVPYHHWLEEVPARLKEEKVLEIHRLLLQELWNRWRKMHDHFIFSLEAFLLYLARWDVMEQWQRLDASRGRQEVEQYFKEQLHEHPIRFE